MWDERHAAFANRTDFFLVASRTALHSEFGAVNKVNFSAALILGKAVSLK